MEEMKKKRKRNAFDRIVLSSESQAALSNLITEVSEATNGLLKLQGREIANFLIQSRSHSLSPKELSDIRAKFFNDSKAANWMVNQIREARSNGESVDLEELFKKVRMQSVEQKPRATKAPKAQKSKTAEAPKVETEGALNEESMPLRVHDSTD